MSGLIPLRDIPPAARSGERLARAMHSTELAALTAAEWRIESAPGCYGASPAGNAPVIGWVVTRGAAQALATRETVMRDGGRHRRLQCRHIAPSEITEVREVAGTSESWAKLEAKARALGLSVDAFIWLAASEH